MNDPILIVDDDDNLRETLVAALEALPVDITTASGVVGYWPMLMVSGSETAAPTVSGVRGPATQSSRSPMSSRANVYPPPSMVSSTTPVRAVPGAPMAPMAGCPSGRPAEASSGPGWGPPGAQAAARRASTSAAP